MAANRNVFINCPFDDQYSPILDALIFAVHDCGYIARSALEVSDSGQVRIDKIFKLIGQCRFGIHDLSRTELDAGTALPRFNMPLELGIFLGAQRYGPRAYRQKKCLVLIRKQYLHQKYCSDIAGQDVHAHGLKPARAIAAVRTWLRSHSSHNVPSAGFIQDRYREFRRKLPRLCSELRLDPDDLEFSDTSTLVAEWIIANP